MQAARAILEHPMSYPEVVGRLVDADSATSSTPDEPGSRPDVMEVTVGDLVRQVRRDSAFTATEHARGAALADLVSDVLRRTCDAGPVGRTVSGRRLGEGVAPEYVVDGAHVSALVDGVVVGLASVLVGDEPTSRPVTLRVDPTWQRRGIGTRLLTDVCRLAHAMGPPRSC